MYLFHYYDKRSGPFRSLTMLSNDDALAILEKIKKERPNSFASQRDMNYIVNRSNCEAIVRAKAKEKGIIMDIESPYYFVIGACDWLKSWYEYPEIISIPIGEFDTSKISFTYGDSMPTFSPRVNDGKEYRKKVYTYEEILSIIEKYGLPQEWNVDGAKGPERYIEAQVWTNSPVERYKCAAEFFGKSEI
ncbi:hypothetical protein [Eubacterium ruminantium]|uniref:Uncharacterized protein n=2 Tax=Eubacteriaceae TaxID=186806 RepID=A0A1T4LEW1_9FIRM|nr:hypothetical protein [Eubacterium ruminantium]MCR5368597.1 hypothetical protein [Eubacterium sp.]SCW65704.1 hypothetical protein SAMN05660484_02335 [Eubacterium ruminantium]SDN26283.1 hypothetical protein SAMN04490370_11517 [Eubacterium ruminantium]SJZ53200.1 hypothetical protein SAMN02745110_00821 [Eubacterium ruminantium]